MQIETATAATRSGDDEQESADGIAEVEGGIGEGDAGEGRTEATPAHREESTAAIAVAQLEFGWTQFTGILPVTSVCGSEDLESGPGSRKG